MNGWFGPHNRQEMVRKTRLIEVDREIANIMKATKAELERCEVEREELRNAPPVSEELETLVEEVTPLAERYRLALAGYANWTDDDLPALRSLVAAVTGGEIILRADADGKLSAEVRGHYRALWMTPIFPVGSGLPAEMPNKMAGKKWMVAGTRSYLYRTRFQTPRTTDCSAASAFC